MLQSLRLQDFRCFDSLAVDLCADCTVFIGDNAQGKTSILEAVCLLLRLASPRAKSWNNMIQFEQSAFGVAGDFLDVNTDSSLALSVRYGKLSKSKLLLSVDSEEVNTQNEYLSQSGLVVWIGNGDVDLVRGSAGARRHYLDFLCSQVHTGYRTALSRYRKVLKSRNLLLKQSRLKEVDAYSELLIEYGEIIINVREQFIKQLEPVAMKAHRDISLQDETLSLEYVCNASNSLRDSLIESRDSELRQKQTLVGPHRDDLIIRINDMLASDFASEGQQRTIALALKLAQGELLYQKSNKEPIYLLDDIFGELDQKRRNALLLALPADAQKLITTTNLEWIDETPSSWAKYSVSGARLLE